VREMRRMLRLWPALETSRRHVLAAAGAVLGVMAGAAGVVAPWHSPLSPSAVHADSTFDNTLFSLFNQDRANHGLPPLQSSTALTAVAENSTYTGCGFSVAGRAEDMVARNYFSHTILNCGSRTAFDVLHADGIAFSSAAENLGYASGVSDPAAAAQWVNTQFMQSPEHSANILDPNFNTVGIGSWWTAAGQTWSGAGGSQSNVIVAAAELIQAPQPTPVSAPTQSVSLPHPAPAPVYRAPVRTVVPVKHFVVATPRHPAVAPLPAVVAVVDVEDTSPPRMHALTAFVPDTSRVSARVAGVVTPPPSLTLNMACAVAMLAALASLRQCLAVRRRLVRASRPPGRTSTGRRAQRASTWGR
jgi:uncharacterized protein YkwD